MFVFQGMAKFDVTNVTFKMIKFQKRTLSDESSLILLIPLKSQVELSTLQVWEPSSEKNRSFGERVDTKFVHENNGAIQRANSTVLGHKE